MQYLMPRKSNPPMKPAQENPVNKYTAKHFDPEWWPVDEVHIQFPTPKFEKVDKASRQLGFVLRHSSDLSMPPCDPKDGSLSAEVAFALLTQRHMFHQGDSPRTLYDALMLNKKDAGRPRFQVLIRHPSKQEVDDDVACRYIFTHGKMSGMILLRIRSVQGHSGEAMRNISRVGTLRRGDEKHLSRGP